MTWLITTIIVVESLIIAGLLAETTILRAKIDKLKEDYDNDFIHKDSE